jgi:hypothetical protein
MGFLYAPYNVYITEDIIYVTDFGDFKIKQYDRNGKFITAIGSYGTGTGQFVRPKGITVDKEANLYEQYVMFFVIYFVKLRIASHLTGCGSLIQSSLGFRHTLLKNSMKASVILIPSI